MDIGPTVLPNTGYPAGRLTEYISVSDPDTVHETDLAKNMENVYYHKNTRSVISRKRSEDPDPYQNEKDPKHW